MPTFILKDPNSKGETLIYLTYYFQGHRLKISTGERISPLHWNQLKHRPRSSYIYCATLTKLLDRMTARVKETHISLKSEFEEVTATKLKDTLEMNLRSNGRKQTLSIFFEQYATSAIHKSALKMFRGYLSPKNFDDITPKWLGEYQTYMEYGDYSANYIGRSIGIIREVMTEASRQGLTNNQAYLDSSYRKPSEVVDSIYLSVEELLKIYQVKLTGTLDQVRNRFLIGAFSGLRFSDGATITHDNIRQGLMFDRNKKTGTNVVIPVHWVIDEIMEKHPEGLPPSISNQNTNRYIKKIGELAGINEIVIKTRVRGGKVEERKCEKYQLITSHTARRSACTNMILADISTQAVMRISGHKTEGAFQKYIRSTSEDSARTLADHPFFKKI